MVDNNVAYQIIVGTHVNDVYKELIDMLGISAGEDGSQKRKNKNFVKAALDVVSESMNLYWNQLFVQDCLQRFYPLFPLQGLFLLRAPHTKYLML